MKSIIKSAESSLRERGSKFYGFLFACKTTAEFDIQLHELKKRFPDATHHCCAYRIVATEILEFSNDDGEPSGTAGLPILNELRSADLVNVGAVSVRYYGGSKLGKAGLIEAYGESASLCIQSAEIGELQKVFQINIEYEYTQESQIQQIIRAHDLTEINQKFTEKVVKTVQGVIQNEEQCVLAFNAIAYQGVIAEHLGHTFVMI